MPDSSNSYISKFAPQSHFFTDPAVIQQVDSQAFGPVSDTVFRVTSSFTLQADAPAYAICPGVVLVQPQYDEDTQAFSSDRVNLVLRPYKQPIQGVNIRYFVYRGLKRNDFFGSDGLVLGENANSSDFIKKINASFKAFYTREDANATVPEFLAKYIGYDPTHADSLPLDTFFFKDSEPVQNGEAVLETDFELPMIGMGKTLGNFMASATVPCGIDVVLSYGDYELPATPAQYEFGFNLAYARKKEVTITVSTGWSVYQQKVVREQVYQFLDVAAYYGFHQAAGGSVTAGTSTTKITGENIYNSFVQKFYTKNNLYLYIQSDRGRSYNFYGNYSILTDPPTPSTLSLWVGSSETGLALREFAKDKWPLLIEDTAQAHGNNRNLMYLQLTTDNNVSTALFGAVAQIDNAQQNNFINADNLLLPPTSTGEVQTITKPIVLSNPAVGSSGSKVNVATFNLLLYQGVTYRYSAGQGVDEEGNPVEVFAEPNFFDDVFDKVNATPLLKKGTNQQYSSLTSQRLKLINQHYNQQQQGLSAVQTTIINDVLETGVTATPTVERVTYLTEAVEIVDSSEYPSGTLASDTKTSPAVAGTVSAGKTYKLPSPFYFNLVPFTDSTEAVTGLVLKTLDNSIPTKIILGITKAENELLMGLVTSRSLINPRIFLVDLFESDNQLISMENILFQKYRIGLVGEQANGELQLFMPSQDIIAFSLDRKYHFSKDYSEHVQEEPILSLNFDYTL